VTFSHAVFYLVIFTVTGAGVTVLKQRATIG